ncbi:MAG: hypothetical protein U0Q04_08955 [Microbacterium sp.]
MIAGMVLGLLAVVATYAFGAINGIQLSAAQWIGTDWSAGARERRLHDPRAVRRLPHAGENAAQVTSLIVVFLSFLGGLLSAQRRPDFMPTIARFTPVYGIGSSPARR